MLPTSRTHKAGSKQRTPRLPLGSVPGRRNDFDTRAVARCLKKREAQRILLSAKYSAYQTFLVFSHPIASTVLAHFEVVQGECDRRRKARHIRSANLLFPSLSRAANTIGGPSLDCERSLISLPLTSHNTRRLHRLRFKRDFGYADRSAVCGRLSRLRKTGRGLRPRARNPGTPTEEINRLACVHGFRTRP